MLPDPLRQAIGQSFQVTILLLVVVGVLLCLAVMLSGLPKRLEVWEQTRARLFGRLSVAFVIIFIVYFSMVVVLRHDSLKTAMLDLGNLEQTLWQTVHGRPFRMTTDAEFFPLGGEEARWTGPPHGDLPETRLAFHVEPILVPLSIVYAVLPRPETLLVLQVLIIGVSGLLVGSIAKVILHSPFAQAVFTFAFLVAPAIHRAVLFDVHTIIFGIPLVLVALRFILTDRPRRGAWVALSLLAVREEMTLVVLALGAFLASNPRRRKYGLVVILVSLLWLLALLGILRQFNPGGFEYGDHYQELKTAIAEGPAAVVRTLGDPARLYYLWWLVVPLAFLPLVSGVALLAAGPAAIVFLSNVSPRHLGLWHYHALTFTLLLVAAIMGGQWIRRWRRGGRWSHGPVMAVFLLSLGNFLVLMVPGTPYAHQARPLPPRPDWSRLAALKEAVRRIPVSASVAVANRLGPWVAARERVVIIDSPKRRNAEYLLVSTDPNLQEANRRYQAIVSELEADPTLQVIWRQAGILLFQRVPPRDQ